MKKRKLKVDAAKPRQLNNQNAWYYLPYACEKNIEIYRSANSWVNNGPVATINARKLLRELLAVGVKP